MIDSNKLGKLPPHIQQIFLNLYHSLEVRESGLSYDEKISYLLEVCKELTANFNEVWNSHGNGD